MSININTLLLGRNSAVPASSYQSFSQHIFQDAKAVRGLLTALEQLELRYTAAFASFSAPSRGYFTPDEDDEVRGMLLTYRNIRLATFSAVWRYAHYSLEVDKTTQLKGFVLGYATALAVFSKSLRFIRMCEPFALIRAKLNEPDERFGIEAGYYDNVVETYCSLNYLMLFAKGDKFWRQNRKAIEALGLESDPIFQEFVPKIKRLRAVCWKQFWPAFKERFKHEQRHTFKMLFAPLRMTGWGAQTLLGHAVARLRTTLDYQPSIKADSLEYLAKRLQPGDLLFTRTEHKATTALLPGFFGHVAIYIGSESQLDCLGIPSGPMLEAIKETMRASPSSYGWVLEAKHQGVIVQSLQDALYCDHVMVLRPNLTQGQVEEALTTMVGFLGTPYDFDFDFGRTSHVVCTELVYRALHNKWGFHFDLIKRMGRYTLSVDDIVKVFLVEKGKGTWIPIALVLEGHDHKAFPLDPSIIPEKVAELLGVS